MMSRLHNVVYLCREKIHFAFTGYSELCFCTTLVNLYSAPPCRLLWISFHLSGGLALQIISPLSISFNYDSGTSCAGLTSVTTVDSVYNFNKLPEMGNVSRADVREINSMRIWSVNSLVSLSSGLKALN